MKNIIIIDIMGNLTSKTRREKKKKEEKQKRSKSVKLESKVVFNDDLDCDIADKSEKRLGTTELRSSNNARQEPS